MDISRVHPSLRSRAGRMPPMNLENRLALAAAGGMSRMLPGKKIDGVTRQVVRLGDGVSLRVYTPAAPSGAGLLWIHGGGLVLGAAAMDDRFCGETARDLGVTIVSVDYRLAPRHPFPAALDDAHRGWQWLTAHAGELGVSTERLAVGGQSAGGGLAASLVQKLHDEGAGVAAQWLFCPMLDDRTALNRALDAEAHLVWNNRSNLVGWRSYLGAAFGQDEPPRYSVAARRDDLSGLPPVWLYASDIELFHDEVVQYAGRLRAAGVETTLDVISGAPHGVEAWAPGSELARALVGRARQWLGGALA